MKKLVYCLFALATLLTTASCVKELESKNESAGGTADITLAVSLGSQTKAFADGTKVDKLYAGLYELNGSAYKWVADNSDAPAAISGKAATVTFDGKIELGKSYMVVFWAQKEGAPYYIDWAKTVTSGPTVTATATGSANDESRDAFYGRYETGVVTGSIDLTGSPITLKRPFAQVNVLVPISNLTDATASVTSSMSVAQAPSVLNLATRATSDPADWTFSTAAIAEETFGNYSSTHRYVAMNYVLVDQSAAGAQYDVTFSVTCDSQVAANKQVKNTPLKVNARTNIVGCIFDQDFDMSIPVIIDSGIGSEQELTTVTVTVGQNAATAVALDAGYNADPSLCTAIPIEVAVSHPVEVEADKPMITVEPGDVASAEWNLSTGKLEVTPLVANGSAVITLVFPAVTKTDYSAATVQIYVKVGNGSNEEPEQVAAPTFTPAAGEYTAAQSVEIACETDGASIYYTTDGTDPTSASTAYTDAIAVGETMTIKAIAVKEGWTDSEIASAAYTINISAEPQFTTVAELKALLGTESDTYTGTLTDAVVTFVAGTSDAVIKDATGSILFHKEAGHNLLQGQTISGDVIAEAVLYNGINQITDLAATVEGTGSAVEPQVVTLAQLAADYAAYESAYVKVVGMTSKTTTTAKGNINVTQDATDYVVYTNVNIPVNTGDIFTAEGTVTKYNMTEELKVWKSADLTVTTPAPTLSATPATTTVDGTATSVSWAISSNTDWTITPGTGVTASATSGNGNADVTLSFAANTGSEAATYTATVSATGCDDVTITITQTGSGKIVPITVSPSSITSNTAYGSYSNDSWIMTCGSANGTFGSHTDNAEVRMKLGDRYVVATALDSEITADSIYYAAIISKTALDAGITTITLGGTPGAEMTVGVTVSTDGTTWTKLADFGTATEFSFAAQPALYYAIVIKATGASTAKYTNFSATFSN